MKDVGKKRLDKDAALVVAFVHAAKNGQAEVVGVLLGAGVDVHASDDLALRAAAEFGQTEVVSLLLKHGADVHARNDASLASATAKGHKVTAALLKRWAKKR